MLKVHYNPLKIKRGKTFTEDEKMRLYQCMIPDLDIIDSKSMDSVTVVRKAEAWKRVTLKFNASPAVVRRTTEQLKKCFENAKCRKQWVKPDSVEVARLLHSEGPDILTVTGSGPGSLEAMHSSALGDILQGGVEGTVHHDPSDNYELYDELHSGMAERLENIKCELIDMTENSNEEGRHSSVVDLENRNEFSEDTSNERTSRDFTEAGNEEQDGVENSESAMFPEEMDEVAETMFVDVGSVASTFRPRVSRLYVAPSRKKRRISSSAVDDPEIANDTHHHEQPKETAVQGTDRPRRIRDLEERLLRAQVREAEAAASAAEMQLQLNQLALQHAEAEELRRQQLHELRMRRLAQLTGADVETVPIPPDRR